MAVTRAYPGMIVSKTKPGAHVVPAALHVDGRVWRPAMTFCKDQLPQLNAHSLSRLTACPGMRESSGFLPTGPEQAAHRAASADCSGAAGAAHAPAVALQEQHARRLGGLVGVFPDPAALGVGFAEGFRYGLPQGRGIERLAGFQHRQQGLGGGEQGVARGGAGRPGRTRRDGMGAQTGRRITGKAPGRGPAGTKRGTMKPAAGLPPPAMIPAGLLYRAPGDG